MSIPNKIEITQSELKNVIHYDDISGIFTWTKSLSKRAKQGSKAGSINSGGYIKIVIKNKGYRAHRLAFIYMLGKNPNNFVDHIDGNTLNNSWSNLREATHAENMQNIKKSYKNNKLGIVGVSMHQGKYKAQIAINKKHIFIGLFDTKEDASNAYLKFKRKIHEFNTI